MLLPAAIALLLAAVHAGTARLCFLRAVPRSWWLSAAGGVAVGFVFVHILPDLGRSQAVYERTGPLAGFLEHHVYLVGLAGLVTFYGVERAVKSGRGVRPGVPGVGVFWLHVGSFAAYNALVGYLVTQREEGGTRSLVLFGVAMALHFVVNDFGLRQDHRERYDRVGRWVLAVAVLTGWAIGAATDVHPAAVAVFFAFLAGGTVLNVLKEELPEERESNLWAFVIGAAGYTVVLLAV